LAQDDYYYEIQLTNKQLVFYFMAGASGLILAFLAGVMVGRGVDSSSGEVRAARAGAEERVITEEPVKPVASPSPDLRYAERLEGNATDDVLAKPPAAAPSAAASAAAAPPLGVGAPPSTAAAARLAPPSAAPPATAAARPSPAAAPSARPSAPPTAAGSPKPAAAKPPASPPPGAAPRPGTGAFTIQVGAFKDRASADTVVSRLKARGFAAFVVKADGTEGLFNVRVGQYGERAEAERVKQRLQDEEKFKPFIVKQ
jgi:cell division septation protein DedD